MRPLPHVESGAGDAGSSSSKKETDSPSFVMSGESSVSGASVVGVVPLVPGFVARQLWKNRNQGLSSNGGSWTGGGVTIGNGDGVTMGADGTGTGDGVTVGNSSGC